MDAGRGGRVSVARIAALLQAGELSPREAVQHYLERIDALDGELNAYISVRGDEALAEAEALERSAERGPLWGVPVAVKDVLDVAGARTTAASRVLAESEPAARDSAVVARLRAAGAVILGKLNTHEFAFGARTDSEAFGPARNPWDTSRIAGGSSGGSGVAAAADLAAGTLGTDTAGSVRIPACYNGVSGIRPTLGRVPNRGVRWVSWTFDTIGPIARSAEDCALLLQAIAGHDPEDSSTARVPVPEYRLDGDVRGLRVGVVTALFGHELDARIGALVSAAIEELRALGARAEPVEIPRFEQAGTIQQLIMLPEATAAHLPWLREKLDLYGADVRVRLLVGTALPPSAVVTGQRARRAYVEELDRVLERVDVLAAPAMPTLPPRHGEPNVDVNGESIPYRLPLIRFNSPWSLAGLPAMSVPCGFVDGLPTGFCLAGRRFEEENVLRAAHAYQQATDWHERRPSLAAASAAPALP
jgi:aspartyl-tRNA(Asn)/glutamyl-tRNA(Gln) amidotransferase subunit A